MLSIILFVIGICCGYKLRKLIEVVHISKQVKYVQVTVEKILAEKSKLTDKVQDKFEISKEDYQKLLEIKEGVV